MKNFSIVICVVLAISGCSLMPSPGRVYLNPMDLSHKNEELKLKEVKQKSLAARYETEKVLANKKLLLTEYIDTTININRKACLNHLRLAAYTNTHRDFYKSEIASTGIFSAAIMGATKVSSPVIAATASLFAFLENSLENYDNAYEINSEELMIDLVKAKYTEMELNIWAKSSAKYTAIDAISNIERADITLDEHQYLCTYEGLMSIVRESIKAQSKAIVADAKTKHSIK
jgi:hypothetical protein